MYIIVHYSTIQYSTVQYNTLQYSTVMYCIYNYLPYITVTIKQNILYRSFPCINPCVTRMKEW